MSENHAPKVVVEPPRKRRRRNLGDALVTANQLTEREEKLARRARETKKLALQLRLKDYGVILAWAERFDDDVNEVVRACLFAGMDYYAGVLTRADRQGGPIASPFSRGSWSSIPAVRADPALLNGLPPVAFDRVAFRPGGAFEAPPPNTVSGPHRLAVEYPRHPVAPEPVYQRPPLLPREPGMPSGATEPAGGWAPDGGAEAGPWTDGQGDVVEPPLDEPPPP